MVFKLFRRPLQKKHQAAVRRVKDSAYWGLPEGTPIKPGMKPKGPKAKAAAKDVTKATPAKKATAKVAAKKTPAKKTPAKKTPVADPAPKRKAPKPAAKAQPKKPATKKVAATPTEQEVKTAAAKSAQPGGTRERDRHYLENQPFTTTVSPDLTEGQLRNCAEQLEAVPDNVKRLLASRGIAIHLWPRAGDAPDYVEQTPPLLTGSGNPLAEVSHYHYHDKSARISVNADIGPGSHAIAHELGHALDRETHDPALDRWLHDDAAIIALHRKHILTNPQTNEYVRQGSEGTEESGRKEWIAESYANALHARRMRALGVPEDVATQPMTYLNGNNNIPGAAMEAIFESYGLL